MPDSAQEYGAEVYSAAFYWECRSLSKVIELLLPVFAQDLGGSRAGEREFGA